MSDKDIFIGTENLTYEYPAHGSRYAPVKALDNISLSIKKGEFIAVIGKNGSGKSTLAKTFNALLLPASGTVYVKSMDTSDENNLWNIRKEVGLVFQNPDNQIVSTIVEDDVAFGPENLGVPPEEIKERVLKSLKTVGMEEFIFSLPDRLSGGQKQKIAIAGILAMNPECVVFDEATSMLDPKGRKEVLDAAIKINRDEGITVIYITHHMDEAVYAGRIIVMDEGKIIMEGTPRDVFGDVDRLEKAGLRVPDVSQLIYRLNKHGMNIPTGILSFEELFEYIAGQGDRFPVQVPQINIDKEPASLSKEKTIISFKDVSYTYSEGSPFQNTALEKITLDISENEYIGIIGHTGSGKSTLVQHINGLLFPTSGHVFVDGMEVKKGSQLRQIRKNVGLVFQYPESQFFQETVYKDIAYGPENQGLNREETRQRVLEAIHMVGLEEQILDRSPFELSGGQKRRAAIAGVLALDTKILILDEPTSGLDPSGRKEILELIAELKRKKNLTVILVTHDIEDAARYADRICIMRGGKIQAFDVPEKVFGTEDMTDAAMIPPVNMFMKKLKQLYPTIRNDIFTLEDAENELLKSFKAGYGK